ncbi:chemotaxis protein CheW [Brachyspira hampsonii]|uniref:Chemotaxis protein CheW n=2 Tax=Brachyspira hampsonii TaxID=1287055 RepID=A0A1E5NKB7_9SPIR|nr:chemotaxis protein CheW [Brachyspira hampsonii]ASJ20145.1 chemotaxis protein CheW [Brachyspira hampsonii]EKV56346.1 chemotaxis protein CheW [Brachyspira hampsonii 30446]ELV06552.1 chemotaxis protein CheW [Brachyspira hampsonii 30599]MBW5379667.1 purine-binding chemotaxis protein CheW [Brachyspira hampsonii]MBW5390065.1 purine-binding chemotaxis protein CheW [Brachyspira hampsonii]
MLDNQKINAANIPQVGGTSLEHDENISIEPSQQFLVFKIDNEEYALDVLSIEGIVGVTNITPVPGSPKFMRGLMNLRGNILHIVDIRIRFGLDRRDDHSIEDDVIIVISTTNRKFGILADMVSDVITVYESQMTETPIDNMRGLQISNVIRLENKIIMVLPIEEIIKSNDANNQTV